jgi:hypothetical protein
MIDKDHSEYDRFVVTKSNEEIKMHQLEACGFGTMYCILFQLSVLPSSSPIPNNLLEGRLLRVSQRV